MQDSRPGPIIGVCIVWLAFTAYAYFSFLNADLSAFPDWFPVYYTAISLIGAIGIAGIWLMRKWGLAIFVISIIVDQTMLMNQQHWHVFSLLLPLMVIMVAIAHLQDMR